MRDLLLLIDVINSFRHPDGASLAASFRRRYPALAELISETRRSSIPIVYANDNWGVWDSDIHALVASAIQEGRAGDLVASILPADGDRIVIKPRYSAFRATPLPMILEQLDVERIVMAGTATEMCVAQTAIDAREAGYKVTIVADACASVSEDNEALALEYLMRVVGVRVETVRAAFEVGHRPRAGIQSS